MVVPGPFSVLVNYPKTAIACKNLETRYFKRKLSKILKKLTLVFLSNPVPFNGQDCEKRRFLRTSDQSLFRFQNKFKKISLLTDQV